MTANSPAPEQPHPTGTRFGLTILSVVAGELVDQPVEAMIVTGNTRGLLGAGPAGSLRSAAGPEPEAEARERTPYDLGTAYMTGPGQLGHRGVVNLIHAVVSVGLGERPRQSAIPAALKTSLDLSRAARHHSIALPVVGAMAGSPLEDRVAAAEVVIQTLVAHLRAGGSRPERAILVSRFDDDLTHLASIVARARERLWTGPV